MHKRIKRHDVRRANTCLQSTKTKAQTHSDRDGKHKLHNATGDRGERNNLFKIIGENYEDEPEEVHFCTRVSSEMVPITNVPTIRPKFLQQDYA